MSDDPDRPTARKAESTGAQAAVGVWIFLALLVLAVLGIGWVLGHRWSIGAPELRPSLPTLPGKTPEPQKP